jgi:hypothetical protein
MSYFKTSYATLQSIAKTGRFEDVAGFLVLARHASGRAVSGFEPYRFSGAGINSIHEKAGISEEVSRGVVERLKGLGVIRSVTPELKKIVGIARWEILQGPLDLDLPHSFVDPLKNSDAETPLKRMRAAVVEEHRREQLHHLSTTEVRLDALMVLLGIYRHTHMEAYGGLDPRCVHRKWTVESKTPKSDGIRWGAEPGSSETAFYPFIENCSLHLGVLPEQKNKDALALRVLRFWNGWSVVKKAVLIYEAVSLFDAPVLENNKSRLKYSIRINDYHAGSVFKTGDPSLLRSLELLSGTDHAYYTPVINDRDEPEAMWVTLPDTLGELVGVWRPRYRTGSPDVGAWLDVERTGINSVLAHLNLTDVSEISAGTD